ncbi:ComF family protein [Acinetobacter towneri]|uniref:ComF family protein n=1 Tax=Acinetobacter towneri TaxID=202956 RepID=UPI0015D304A4|nr:phosphoribosyltransferase family protein [Acinetobacter towneri]MCO8056514.1 ComF family protein [Acinetobacter towneri]
MTQPINLVQRGIQWLRQLQPCQLCHSDTQWQHSVCQTCWQQLPWRSQAVQRQEMQIHVAFDYHYPINRIIQQFKYEQQLHYQLLLAGALKQLSYPKIQAIVPMPISTVRLTERGYNQSLLLAKGLARHLNVPIWQPVTRLQQHAQKGLSRLERLEDIQQQFQIQTAPKIRYRRVLIVDDVVTTGSSIHALKQQLLKLGCQKVEAVCLASAE